MTKKSILVFGVGELQCSIINRAKEKGLFVVGIDPCADAYGKELVDAFEVVDGQDYERTLAVARKYNVAGIITAATDKPLVMMARVAKELGVRFFSEETARWSTDKYQMKQRFIEAGILCARGRLIKSVDDARGLNFPLILKPRDNSGSRGVIWCCDEQALRAAMNETFQYTRMDNVLVEEFIEGPEYSIESLHFDGRSGIIQFTEKQTTPFPYNVELGHIQPAQLSGEQKERIHSIIAKIAAVMRFENCPSHTEIKINERGIYVIETSPRLGGDYITSMLTPLSTGIAIEDQVLNISLGKPVDLIIGRRMAVSAIRFFSFPECMIKQIDPEIETITNWPNVFDVCINFKAGDKLDKIMNSLGRYGYFLVKGNNYDEISQLIELYHNKIKSFIKCG